MTTTISLAASPEAGIFLPPEGALAMAKFRGAVISCVVCGTEFRVPPSRAAVAKACSHECAVKVRAKSIERKVELLCNGCGEPFEVPRCHASRRSFCSRACMEASPSIRDLKASRIGTQNPSWKGGRSVRSDRYIYATGREHPFAAANGMVLEHRLVMERWLRENEPDHPALVSIDGQLYLSPEYEVHHRDLSRSNNAIDNLQCLTKAEHRAVHTRITREALELYRVHKLGFGPN